MRSFHFDRWVGLGLQSNRPINFVSDRSIFASYMNTSLVTANVSMATLSMEGYSSSNSLTWCDLDDKSAKSIATRHTRCFTEYRYSSMSALNKGLMQKKLACLSYILLFTLCISVDIFVQCSVNLVLLYVSLNKRRWRLWASRDINPCCGRTRAEVVSHWL